MKKCSQCRVIQSQQNFSPSESSRGDGYASWCKKCCNKRGHPTRTKKQVRADNLYKKYRIRVSDFDAMMRNQDFQCLICGWRAFFNDLLVDHCHTTWKVRGLLCKPCNTGLGMFRDNVETLESAILYLKQS